MFLIFVSCVIQTIAIIMILVDNGIYTEEDRKINISGKIIINELPT